MAVDGKIQVRVGTTWAGYGYVAFVEVEHADGSVERRYHHDLFTTREEAAGEGLRIIGRIQKATGVTGTWVK